MFPHCFVSNLERRLHNLKYPENEEDMIFCVQRLIYFCIPVVYTEYTQAINSQIKVLNAQTVDFSILKWFLYFMWILSQTRSIYKPFMCSLGKEGEISEQEFSVHPKINISSAGSSDFILTPPTFCYNLEIISIMQFLLFM